MPPGRLGFPKPIAALARKLEAAGVRTLVVGGAVRDLVLGRTPADYDLVCAAPIQQIKRVFGRKCVVVGKRFPVIHFKSPKLADVQIGACVQARRGVRDWHEVDWQRRDFTVNTLYAHPRDGRVLVGHPQALLDLECGVVATVVDPAASFTDDPIRILRAVRLAAKLGFRLDDNVERAMQSIGPNLLADCSPARRMLEAQGALAAPAFGRILTDYNRFGFLDAVYPGLGDVWAADDSVAAANRATCQRIFETLTTGPDRAAALVTYAAATTAGQQIPEFVVGSDLYDDLARALNGLGTTNFQCLPKKTTRRGIERVVGAFGGMKPGWHDEAGEQVRELYEGAV